MVICNFNQKNHVRRAMGHFQSHPSIRAFFNNAEYINEKETLESRNNNPLLVSLYSCATIMITYFGTFEMVTFKHSISANQAISDRELLQIMPLLQMVIKPVKKIVRNISLSENLTFRDQIYSGIDTKENTYTF